MSQSQGGRCPPLSPVTAAYTEHQKRKGTNCLSGLLCAQLCTLRPQRGSARTLETRGLTLTRLHLKEMRDRPKTQQQSPRGARAGAAGRRPRVAWGARATDRAPGFSAQRRMPRP